MRLAILYFCILLNLFCIVSGEETNAKVHQVEMTLPRLAEVNITKPQKFMNDLMLSPMESREKPQWFCCESSIDRTTKLIWWFVFV